MKRRLSKFRCSFNSLPIGSRFCDDAGKQRNIYVKTSGTHARLILRECQRSHRGVGLLCQFSPSRMVYFLEQERLL